MQILNSPPPSPSLKQYRPNFGMKVTCAENARAFINASGINLEKLSDTMDKATPDIKGAFNLFLHNSLINLGKIKGEYVNSKGEKFESLEFIELDFLKPGFKEEKEPYNEVLKYIIRICHEAFNPEKDMLVKNPFNVILKKIPVSERP